MADDVRQDAVRQGFPAPLYDFLFAGGGLKGLTHYFRSSGRLGFEDAEELAHDVVILAIRKYDTFRDHSDLKTWLWVLARQALISRHRNQRSSEAQLDDAAWLELSETVPDGHSGKTAELRRRLDAAFQEFARLHPERAEILKLSFEDWTTSEIAGYLGRTEAATRELLYQTRKQFRPFVEGLQEDLRDVE